MVLDYGALSTWQTPDLLYWDSRLVKKTRVMGMSQTAVTNHIVALVCTAGVSLPINLGFCIWHCHRYSKVKKERKMIRQILGTRNMAYQGRGHWVNVNPNPGGGQWLPVQPTHNATVSYSQQDSGRDDLLQRLANICQIISCVISCVAN